MIRLFVAITQALALLSAAVLLPAGSSSAQGALGQSLFFAVPTEPLLLQAGQGQPPTGNTNFVQNTGGVAFWQTAVSRDGAKIVDLAYRPDDVDGARLRVTLEYPDGHTEAAIANLYDWQLTPIAQYAATPYQACFSFAGRWEHITARADDTEMQRLCAAMDAPLAPEVAFHSRHGLIARYHPAFLNTLLGTRLMQADVMLLRRDVTAFRGAGAGAQIGPGEDAPIIAAGDAAFNAPLLAEFRDRWYRQGAYNGYVICDTDNQTRFGVRDGALAFEGEPIWYLWTESASGAPLYQRADTAVLSAVAPLIRQINPCVYEAVRNTMHYSALFRSAKASMGEKAYAQFLATLPDEHTRQTPTIMLPGVD